MKKLKKHKHLISAYIVSFFAVAFTLLPITWLFMLSIKSKGETFTKPPKWIFDPTINNYINLWDNDLFKDTFINSIFITLISIILSVTIALFAAYALKRYQIKFKTAFMQWLLLAYMLPEFLFVLPMFTIYQTIGIYDTYLGMAIIYQVHVLPFSIWMLRSFLEEIPKEIDDAAIIDGCNPLQAIYRIYLPLIIPGIVATAILNGIWVWNELAIALGLTFFDAQPITVGVASFRGYASIDWGGMTGSAIISMIPMVLFAAFAQKHIVKGLTLGSVKG
jgi:ABC-type glycerol-3-phosphate transport system permease component|tara:strand:- start:5533 stop:6363 length:831 start_codon:yes stop_codon:yes gene_type:complete